MRNYIVLENGEVFEGEAIGSKKEVIFNIVVNSNNLGYTETLTDPAFFGEGIVFKNPLIGNTKVNLNECESQKIYASCAIFNTLANFEESTIESAIESENSDTNPTIITIQEFLEKFNIPAITEVDTKNLCKTIKKSGSMKACITSDLFDLEKIIDKIKSTDVDIDYEKISTSQVKSYGKTKAKQIAILDLGVKDSIINAFLKRDIGVNIFPVSAPVELILATRPNGIVLPNGPGNPNDFKYTDTIRKMCKTSIPILGIGLGNNLLALVHDFNVRKLAYPKIGSNYTTKNLFTESVYVVSQNTKYEIDERTLLSNIAESVFVDTADNTIMGLKYIDKKILGVTFNPEGAPGSQDAEFVFDEFINLM